MVANAILSVRPVLGAEVKFFGRHRNGMIRRVRAGLQSSAIALGRRRQPFHTSEVTSTPVAMMASKIHADASRLMLSAMYTRGAAWDRGSNIGKSPDAACHSDSRRPAYIPAEKENRR